MPLELGHSPASGVSVANYHRELLGYTPSPPPRPYLHLAKSLLLFGHSYVGVGRVWWFQQSGYILRFKYSVHFCNHEIYCVRVPLFNLNYQLM